MLIMIMKDNGDFQEIELKKKRYTNLEIQFYKNTNNYNMNNSLELVKM